jgi:hypothetical protein
LDNPPFKNFLAFSPNKILYWIEMNLAIAAGAAAVAVVLTDHE